MNPLQALGREAAANVGEGPGSARSEALRERIVASAQVRSARALWVSRGAWSLAGVGVAVLMLLVVRVLPQAAPGNVAAESVAKFREGAWVSAPEASSRELAFEDGSRVLLQAKARARLTEIGKLRVRVDLEAGRMEAHIRPNTGTAWSFEAGPYRVQVVGTVFGVDWYPEEERIAVRVDKGIVRVRGGQLEGDGVRVRAGERFEGDFRRAQSLLTHRTAALGDTDGEKPVVKSVPPGVAPAGPAAPSGEPKEFVATAPAPDWRTLARAGEQAAALALVSKLGLSQVIDQSSLVDLQLLADTARYAQALGTAQTVLSALRQRFPASSQAGMASFLLGRLASELQNNPTLAAHWFETYLQESPKGALAPEAQGRLIQAYLQSGQRARAERQAERYLALYPNGPSAKLARGILQGGRLRE